MFNGYDEDGCETFVLQNRVDLPVLGISWDRTREFEPVEGILIGQLLCFVMVCSFFQKKTIF